ncbi:MAG: hypothetical protein M3235_09985 [Actinomycetota bacterium]|nr:hypothetical protein [Actinomycetota bacterium]
MSAMSAGVTEPCTAGSGDASGREWQLGKVGRTGVGPGTELEIVPDGGGPGLEPFQRSERALDEGDDARR